MSGGHQELERRALELLGVSAEMPRRMVSTFEAVPPAVQLAIEHADERCEEIAKAIEAINLRADRRDVEEHCAAIARSFASGAKPMSRHPGEYDVIRHGDRLYRWPDECSLPLYAELYRRRMGSLLPREFWSFAVYRAGR